MGFLNLSTVASCNMGCMTACYSIAQSSMGMDVDGRVLDKLLTIIFFEVHNHILINCVIIICFRTHDHMLINCPSFVRYGVYDHVLINFLVVMICRSGMPHEPNS
jgi:hypothetical protein